MLRPAGYMRFGSVSSPLLLHLAMLVVVCLAVAASYRRTNVELDALRQALRKCASGRMPKLEGLAFSELPRTVTPPPSFGRGATTGQWQLQGSVMDRVAGSVPLPSLAKTNLLQAHLPSPGYVHPTIETFHGVVKGDTLHDLARRYHTSTAAIMEANGLTGSKIRVGATLRIPLKQP